VFDKLEKLEALIGRLLAKLQAVESERNKLREEVASLGKQLEEKELEIIRLKKEHQRAIEQMERESAAFNRDRGRFESKMKELIERLEQIAGGEGQ